MLIKFSLTDNCSLNRNVSYAVGVLARKAPTHIFEKHVSTALKMTSAMYQASEENGAKDNCMSTMIKMLDKFPTAFEPA